MCQYIITGRVEEWITNRGWTWSGNEYDIRKFAESCCGDLPTTVAPSVFAPEGVFKGLNGVREYVTLSKEPNAFQNTSESAYW
jgi:hypothetical protein